MNYLTFIIYIPRAGSINHTPARDPRKCPLSFRVQFSYHSYLVNNERPCQVFLRAASSPNPPLSFGFHFVKFYATKKKHCESYDFRLSLVLVKPKSKLKIENL